MIIRKATIDDLDQIFSIFEWFTMGYAVPFTPEKAVLKKTMSKLLEDSSSNLNVAVVENKIVGYCLAFDHYTFNANGRVLWVEELAVQETHRRRGIGKGLMMHVEKWAEARDSKVVSLATSRAPLFYKAIGYEETASYFRKII